MHNSAIAKCQPEAIGRVDMRHPDVGKAQIADQLLRIGNACGDNRLTASGREILDPIGVGKALGQGSNQRLNSSFACG